MGSAECSASPERQISPTDALDLVLKYAAVFATLVYGVGFLEEIEYASWLGVGSVDFPLANPRYFAVGSLMLLACLLSVALVLPAVLPPGPWTIRRAGSDEETLRRLTKEMGKVNYAIATIAAFVRLRGKPLGLFFADGTGVAIIRSCASDKCDRSCHVTRLRRARKLEGAPAVFGREHPEMLATRDDGVKRWRLLPGDTSLGKWRLPLHSAGARFAQ